MAKTKNAAPPRPELDTEVAGRLQDPFETLFMGVIRPNDPLLGEHGNNWQMYRDLRRDGKVFSALQKRVLALISRPWTVQPADGQSTADAEVVQDILGKFNFDRLCADLMDALLVGFSPAEVIWTVQDSLVVPARTAKRAQRRFVYVQDDAQTPPELRLITQAQMIRGEALPERKFIVHRVNPEDDNPYGTGLGLQLYWPVFFKRKGIIAWNKLNDRFGTPTPWGRYPKTAGQKEKDTLFAALKAFSNDGVVMTPEGTLIELLETKLTGGVTTQESLCTYMDDWISEVILGQEPRQKGGGALAAASKEREGVRLELTQADSDLLSETLNSTLIRWICEFNGLAPCLVYRKIAAEEDKRAESETDKNVSEMGFRLKLDAVREKYGDGWEVAPPPVPPAGAGSGLLGLPAGKVAFAEGDDPEPHAVIADALNAATGEVLESWLAQIAKLVDQESDPRRLQARLLDEFGNLPAEQLAELMALGYTAARLAGMIDVADGQ